MRRSGRLKLSCIILVLLLGIANLSYGLIEKKWVRTYDGGALETSTSIAVDPTGNVYVTGIMDNGSDLDYCTIKYRPTGPAYWTNFYDSGGTDRGRGIAVDSTGNVLVTGSCMPGVYNNYCTIKYNSSGSVLWTEIYDGGDHDIGNGIAVDSAGNAYVAGAMYSGVVLWYDVFSLKYNSAGSNEWQAWYFASFDAEDDEGLGVAVDANDDIYVTGYWNNGSNEDIILLKYNSGNTNLWAQLFGGGNEDRGHAVAVDSVGNVYVAGYRNFGNEDFCTIKYSSDGTNLWVRYFDKGNNDRANGVAVDSDDNVYVTGQSHNGLDWDTVTIKYSPSGSAIWTNYFDSGNQDSAMGIAVATNYEPDRIYLTGYIYFGANRDYYTYAMPPVQPKNFSGTGISTSSIQWSWTCAADDEAGFQFQDATHSVLASLPADSITCTENGLSPNKKYIRHITVTNASGNVDSDSSTNYTLASLPSSFICSETNLASLVLSWQTNAGGCFGFVVQRANDLGGVPQLPWVERYTNFTTNIANITVFTDSVGLAGGTAYWYRLAAMNGDGVLTSWVIKKFATTGYSGETPVVEYIKVTNTSGRDYYHGNIAVKIKVNDPDSALINTDLQYKSDSLGINWAPVAIKENTASLAQGEEHQLTWNSSVNIKDKIVSDVVLRITPDDGKSTGSPKETEPFAVNNIQLADKDDIRVLNTFQDMDELDCTEIMFMAQEAAKVEITIYDLKSREIRKMRQNAALGFNSIQWCFDDDEGKQVASGSYIIYVNGAGVDNYVKIGLYR